MSAPFICRGCGREYQELPEFGEACFYVDAYPMCYSCDEEVVTIEQYAADAADHEQSIKGGPSPC